MSKNWDIRQGSSPPLSRQILQSHPPGSWDMLLSKLPNKGPGDALVLQEPAIGTNHHTLLTP